jgi:hypothetical protein
MIFCYAGISGWPSMSPRGSVYVYDEMTLAFWCRPTSSGTVQGIVADPRVALHFRDTPTRTTLELQGFARIVEDRAVRERIYESIPEIERRHDLEQVGTAVLVDVQVLRGTTPDGPVLMER